MQEITKELKKGIKLHYLEDKRFKTNIVSIFLTTPIAKENVTKNTLISLILKRGSANIKTQEDIAKKLENMYGAELNLSIEKIGNNHVIKFCVEVVNDKFLKNGDIFKEGIELLLDIIFNPLLKNGEFKKEYITSERNKLKDIIKSKIDDKDYYSYVRCIEEMYKDDPYGIYKYGYLEDIENINNSELYLQYKKLIDNAKIDIYLLGEFKKEKIDKIFIENEYIKNIETNKNRYNLENKDLNIKKEFNKKNKKEEQIKVIKENMDIYQANLVIGLDLDQNVYTYIDKDKIMFVLFLYNTIFGQTPTSKLFKEVREKESLVYTIRSIHIKQKNSIFIRCGIDKENYEKTLKIIKEQLLEMKKGNFTQEDLKIAKRYIVSNIKTIKDEQDLKIAYYFGQELLKNKINVDQYIKNINDVTKKQIIKVAENININTIYFLSKK